MSIPDWLEAAAKRSTRADWMLGHAFERYLEIEGMTSSALAQKLGCTPDVLQWMSLCRRPVGDSFAEQSEAVAQQFSVELRQLIRVLRHVEVITALNADSDEELAAENATIQLAARDRTHDDENSP